MASGAGGKNTNTSLHRSRPPCPSRLHKEPICATVPPVFPVHWGHLLLSPLQPVAAPSPACTRALPFILAPFIPRQQLLGWPCGSRVLALSTQPPTGRPAPAGPPGAPRPLADPRGGQGETTSQDSCFLGGHRAGDGAICWAAGPRIAGSTPSSATRSDLGPLRPSWASFPPPRGSWPLLGAGTVVSPSGGATKRVLSSQQGTHSRVGCRGLPPWEEPGGRAVQLGKSKGRTDHQLAAESGCLRAEVPRPSQNNGGTKHWSPRQRDGEDRDRGSRCPPIRQPRLGPTSITGCLSDPGRVTLTSPGLSFYNRKTRTVRCP